MSKSQFVSVMKVTYLKILKRVESAKTKSRLRELSNMTKFYADRGKLYYSDVIDLNRRIELKAKKLDH